MAKVATREAYGKTLAKLIVEKDNVIVLDADLTKSTKTIDAKNARADHHFNMGIAEGNMMSVAAGLAASNKVVYASSFAMFAAGRAFEQIRNSICYPNLNVKVCATHAGLTVGEDGASHQSVEDLALMRAIPNMKVFQPCDDIETAAIINAVYDIDGPCYVRLGRSGVERVNNEDYTFELGKGVILNKGEKVAIVATGMMVQEALGAKDLYEGNPTIVNMPTIKPIDTDLLIDLAKTHDVIVTIEEHSIIGGLGGAVVEALAEHNLCPVVRMGVNDTFGESGKPVDLLKKYGLDSQAIANKVNTYL
ncbi:transketolase [Breznakia blatticola]|uniref:Transketolase n=1 Tax=Breznakia blatticola TaxID=1754012 RepID=A0A4R8AAW7_9FIRM|nr:transketolase C-terminal domain-containing protein [Breznakia blatticola]TDW25563.1 transketolase [Breznakia blatticola]